MVQFRRLDPLANAGPWQRATKRAVKTFTLSEEQYERLAEGRPELIISFQDSVVLGRPYRDFLQVHYAYPEVPSFRDNFNEMFKACVAASSRSEAPRGVVLSFRDRPNRPLAEQLFWEGAFDEGKHWVEMDHGAAPEQPGPGTELEGGYKLRPATESDRNVVADIEAEASGLPRLTAAGIDSVYEDARWLYIVENAAGEPVGWLAMRREPSGWGIIDGIFVRNQEKAGLRGPLMLWASAFLRNNGGRRQRRRVNLDETEEMALLRSMGFSPAESGVDYVRPVEEADVRAKVEERQAHGTMIKFGDWR